MSQVHNRMVGDGEAGEGSSRPDSGNSRLKLCVARFNAALGERLAKNMQGSKPVRFKHARRFLMWDQPESVTQNLLRFLHQYQGTNYWIPVNLVPFGWSFS